MNVKTTLEGETVKETILKYSALGKDDQLMAYFQENSTSNGRELCAQYFCDNGQCENIPASVGQFQVQGDDVVMVINNVNITNSGQYTVSHNGVRVVCTFTLDVQEATGQKKETITETGRSQLNLFFYVMFLQHIFLCNSLKNENVISSSKRSMDPNKLNCMMI